MISIMLVLSLQFNRTVWSERYSAANLKDAASLRLMARSGIECALAVLSEDLAQNNVDTLREPWAQSKMLSLQSHTLFQKGHFMVEISDLSAKIQINSIVNSEGDWNPAQKALLGRFLNVWLLDSDSADNLLDFVKDWIDPDDEVTRFGAESGYYQSLDPPYRCSNGPIRTLDRLALIRGMTDELVFGTPEQEGIIEYLSAYGDGKININTAGPRVIKALSEDIDDEMVENLMAYREDPTHELEDPLWYRNVPGMDQVTLNEELLSTQSHYFDIQSTAIMDDMTQSIRTTVYRAQGKPIQILNWKAS